MRRVRSSSEWQLWRRRLTLVAVIWAVLAFLTELAEMSPNLLALGAIAVGFCSVGWLLADTDGLLTQPRIESGSVQQRAPIRPGRVVLLTRMSEDANRRNESGGAPAGATNFRELLRTMAHEKRDSLRPTPTDEQPPAQLSPQLRAYLEAPEAPRIDARTQLQFIEEIQAL